MTDKTEMAEGCGSLFRKRARGGARGGASANTRKRANPSSDSSEGECPPATSVLLKRELPKKGRHNPMVQSTSKRVTTTSGKSTSSGSSDDEESGSEGDQRTSVGAPPVDAYSSSGTALRAGPSDQGATAVSEIDTDIGVDAQAQFERVQKALKEGFDDNVYLGAAMYGAKEKKDTARGNASSGLNRVGPIRAPNFLRQSVRWDFAPDICKDYKETGFCTFGDSCKFLHDRTDYKHGWEIERDFAAGRMKEESDDKYVIHSSDEEDQATLPFKCFICRDSFKNPVVTRCRHYFCEKCALDHFRKTPKCFVCDENTKGVFNVAKELVARLKEGADEGETSKDVTAEDSEEGAKETGETSKGGETEKKEEEKEKEKEEGEIEEERQDRKEEDVVEEEEAEIQMIEGSDSMSSVTSSSSSSSFDE